MPAQPHPMYDRIAAYHHYVDARPDRPLAVSVRVVEMAGGYGYIIFYRHGLGASNALVGCYSMPERAYLAACRHIYGPIPRDFRAGVPAVVGLEGLYPKDEEHDIQYPV